MKRSAAWLFQRGRRMAGVVTCIVVFAPGTVAAAPADALVDVTGQYTGTAQPTRGNASTLAVTFNQIGTTVTGTLSVQGAACLQSLQFSGSVSGTMISGAFADPMSTINISATVSGNQVTGTFSIVVSPCARGSGTFTLTRVALSATPTPMPTATPTPTTTAVSQCVGDCSGGGSVGVSDLITLVNIALGNAQPSACPQGVPTGSSVDIALIIEAVNNALNGCRTGTGSISVN